MGLGANSQRKVAIYDCPKVVGSAILKTMARCGHEVLFEGKLTTETAKPDADVWITKWTALKGPLALENCRPKIGIVSLSVGIEHIDPVAVEEFGLKVVPCPHFSSASVAEHAIALALRNSYNRSVLPPLSSGQVVFSNFSDEYAERIVSNILFRSRQIDQGIKRAKKLDYTRYDEPWDNRELQDLNVLIMGGTPSAADLAQMLSLGFSCNLFGYDASDSLEAYGIRSIHPTDFYEVVKGMDYIFLCTEKFEDLNLKQKIDSERIRPPASEFSESNVSIIGTGRIGSKIARIARLGFNCKVTAFSTTVKSELTRLGVQYASSVSEAIRDANFIFITLPLNSETHCMIGGKDLADLSMDRKRVLVNVARDRVVDNDSVLASLNRNNQMTYATDVLPNDSILWQGGVPDEMTMKFVNHPRVVATPHEGDCSSGSLERLLQEVADKVSAILR